MKYGQEYIARPILDDLGKGVTGHEHMSDLIRCKECKYWNRNNYRCANVPCVVYRMEDDYCSHAKRKEE